jgi:hypothetical protein
MKIIPHDLHTRRLRRSDLFFETGKIVAKRFGFDEVPAEAVATGFDVNI